jgi:hypothetical protein
MSLASQKDSLFGKSSGTTTSSSATKSSTATISASAAPVSKTASLTAAAAKPSTTKSATSSTNAIPQALKVKKVEEGRSYSERGMEHLKTSMFQWKPDHLAAAPLFDMSGECYKVAGIVF